MPLLTAKCSIVSNTMGGADGYWITAIGSSGTEFDVTNPRIGILSDDSIVYSTRCGGSYDSSVGKLTASGELDWSLEYVASTASAITYNVNADMYVDENDNFWFASKHGVDGINITGFTSTGSKITNDYRYSTSDTSNAGNVIDGIGSGNITFVFGEGGGQSDLFVANHNSSSGLVSSYSLDAGVTVIYDSYYQVVRGWNAGSETEILYWRLGNVLSLSKKNPASSSWVFTKTFKGESSTSTSVYPSRIIVDSNQKYFLTYGDTGLGAHYLAKFTDTGTTVSVDWTRKINVSVTSRISQAIDSNGNIYVFSYASSSGLLTKFDSSGTVQWQRQLALTYGSPAVSSSFIAMSMVIDSNDNPIVSAYAISPVYSSGPDISQTALWVAKLPPDGSGTGTYNFGNTVNATYSVGSYSVTSTTAVISSGFVTSFSNRTPSDQLEGSTQTAISLLEEKVDVV